MTCVFLAQSSALIPVIDAHIWDRDRRERWKGIKRGRDGQNTRAELASSLLERGLAVPLLSRQRLGRLAGAQQDSEPCPASIRLYPHPPIPEPRHQSNAGTRHDSQLNPTLTIQRECNGVQGKEWTANETVIRHSKTTSTKRVRNVNTMINSSFEKCSLRANSLNCQMKVCILRLNIITGKKKSICRP